MYRRRENVMLQLDEGDDPWSIMLHLEAVAVERLKTWGPGDWMREVSVGTLEHGLDLIEADALSEARLGTRPSDDIAQIAVEFTSSERHVVGTHSRLAFALGPMLTVQMDTAEIETWTLSLTATRVTGAFSIVISAKSPDEHGALGVMKALEDEGLALRRGQVVGRTVGPPLAVERASPALRWIEQHPALTAFAGALLAGLIGAGATLAVLVWGP